MFHTYILQSETTGKLYIGQTDNLQQRIYRHNNGGSVYTKNKGPWKLLFSIQLNTRAEAVSLEKKLKAFKNPVKVKLWITNQQSSAD